MHSSFKFVIAQVVSFANLTFGILAIIASDVKLAAFFVILSAILDRMDGKIARKLNSTSDFGKELDSLSDLVSFGVAPVVIAWNKSLNFTGFLGYIPLLIFLMAGAFRLARFNIANMSGSYMGMPITIAGVIVAVISFFTSSSLFISILLIILAFLMVSKIKFKKI